MKKLSAVAVGIFWVATVLVHASTVQTTWTAVSFSDWNTASNWNNGVPNNGGGTTYAAIIGSGGNAIINSGATDSIESLALSGQLQLDRSTLNVTGTVTNNYELTLSRGVLNGSVVNTSTGTLQVGGTSGVLVSTVTNLNNSGDVYLYNAGELHITGTFAQQSGTTLTGGSYQISPAGQGGMLYNGASIQAIGASASVTLLYGQPAGGYIRDLTTGADALGGLQAVAGKLFIGSSANQALTSNLQVTGTLSLGEQSTLTTTQSVAFASAGTYEAYFRKGFSGSVSTGLLSADGSISLSGDLKITLSLSGGTLVSDLTGTYQIMSANGGIVGGFANATTDGARVPVYANKNVNGTFQDVYQGSFAIDYATNGVSLADFSTAPVPEPGSLALALVGLMAVGYGWKKRLLTSSDR